MHLGAPSLFPDAILLPVIKRETKGITECRKRSLGGIRLGSLESELVGLPCCSCGCLAATRSFANDLDVSSPNCDADLGGINGAVGACLGLRPHAARVNSPSVPSLVTENTISFGDGMPAL